MLSRIADSLFWINRYMVRAEETARILDVNYYMVLEEAQQLYKLRWGPLIEIAGERERFTQLYRETNAQTVFEFLAFREDNPNSIVQCVARARENARTIRERISREMWEDLNGLYHAVMNFDAEAEILAGPHRFCNVIRYGAHRFSGVTDSTLPHDEGWHFLKIGASLERAEMRARIVDVQYHNLVELSSDVGMADNHQWVAVLKSVGAYEAYRRHYQTRVEPKQVAELLILHPQHPQSIRFAMTELQAALRAISGTGPGAYANEAERLTGKLLENLRYASIDEIFEQGLHQYLLGVQRTCRAIGGHVARTYFYYAVGA